MATGNTAIRPTPSPQLQALPQPVSAEYVRRHHLENTATLQLAYLLIYCHSKLVYITIQYMLHRLQKGLATMKTSCDILCKTKTSDGQIANQIKSRCQPDDSSSRLYSLCVICHQSTSVLTVNVSTKIRDGTITECNSLTQLQ